MVGTVWKELIRVRVGSERTPSIIVLAARACRCIAMDKIRQVDHRDGNNSIMRMLMLSNEDKASALSVGICSHVFALRDADDWRRPRTAC